MYVLFALLHLTWYDLSTTSRVPSFFIAIIQIGHPNFSKSSVTFKITVSLVNDRDFQKTNISCKVQQHCTIVEGCLSYIAQLIGSYAPVAQKLSSTQ